MYNSTFETYNNLNCLKRGTDGMICSVSYLVSAPRRSVTDRAQTI